MAESGCTGVMAYDPTVGPHPAATPLSVDAYVKRHELWSDRSSTQVAFLSDFADHFTPIPLSNGP